MDLGRLGLIPQVSTRINSLQTTLPGSSTNHSQLRSTGTALCPKNIAEMTELTELYTPGVPGSFPHIIDGTPTFRDNRCFEAYNDRYSPSFNRAADQTIKVWLLVLTNTCLPCIRGCWRTSNTACKSRRFMCHDSVGSHIPPCHFPQAGSYPPHQGRNCEHCDV